MDRTTIENAALKLFHERGFGAVKVQDICAECGITKPTFYHYVPSKDDILLRYNEEALDSVEAHVAGTDPEGPVSQLLGAYLVLIDECERIGPDLLSRITCSNLQKNHGSYDTRPTIIERMEAIITAGQRSGAIGNAGDPHQLYLSSAYLYEGLQFMWCLKRGDFDWRAQLREGLTALCRSRHSKEPPGEKPFSPGVFLGGKRVPLAPDSPSPAGRARRGPL